MPLFRSLSLVALGAALVLAFAAQPASPPDSAEAGPAATDSLAPDTTGPALQGLARALRQRVEAGELPVGFWGVHVRDLRTGRTVYGHLADRPFAPASNLKLVTTAAALDVLGADFTYQTRLYASAPLDSVLQDSTLRGDLILRGGGDPTFGSRLDSLAVDPLEQWAEALHRRGVRRIVGRILGDDDALEDRPYPDSWEYGHVATEAWAQAGGGLSYADNLIAVGFENGEVETNPGGVTTVRPSLEEGAGRGYAPLRVRRVVGTNTVRITGQVPTRFNGTVRVPVENPTQLTLAAFADLLREQGITVEADLVDADDLDEPLDYDGFSLLRSHTSTPLVEILELINHRSINFYAEQVLRRIGGGSTRGGIARTNAFLAAAGVDPELVVLEDGSGLSRKNLVAPQAMTALLDWMDEQPYAEVYRRTIPDGDDAEDLRTSTLRYRGDLQGLPIEVKTGAVQGVRALSGYAEGPGGVPLAFSVVVNNTPASAAAVYAALDGIVALIAGRAETGNGAQAAS